MLLENEAVANDLQGANSLRDGTLVSLRDERLDQYTAPAIGMAFEKKVGSGVRAYRMTLSNVQWFELGFEESEPCEIAFVTVRWDEAAGFDLSSDPWEEDAPSGRDNAGFRSRTAA
jgi:hypothetical protein